MGNEEGGERLGGEHAGEPVLEVRAGDRVEGAEGLVEQQDGPAGQERAQERHALAHAAGELRWAGPLELGEAEALEQRGRAPARLAAGDTLALEREPGVAERVPPRQQQVTLGHQRAGLAPCRGLDAPAHPHLPGVGLLETGQELEQRRFAASGRADDRDRLARPHHEVDALERAHGPEAPRGAAQDDRALRT
jgi:hypothetical protein